MPIVLLLAFNWFLLFLALCLFNEHANHYEQGMAGLVALVIVCGLTFLFNCAAGQWLLRLLSGARDAVGREHARIDPVITHVQEHIQGELGFPPIALKLLVVDEPLPNAYAIGKGTLVLSRTLCETAQDDELAAVIAHEFAHLHNGDSHRLGIALGVSLVSLTIAAVSGIILRFFGLLTKAGGKSDGGVALIVMSSIFAAFAGIFWVFSKLGNGVLRLVMLFVGRKQEFAADEFAVKAGYGPGLLSFLDKIKNLQFGKGTHILAQLYDTHPPIMLRIGKLEKLMEKQL